MQAEFTGVTCKDDVGRTGLPSTRIGVIGHYEMVWYFKMTADNVISVRREVLKHIYEHK